MIIINIIRYLGLWQTNKRPPPKPKAIELQIDSSDSQPSFHEDQDFGATADPSAF